MLSNILALICSCEPVMLHGSVAEVTRCPVMPCTYNIVPFFVCSVQHCAHFKVNIVFPHNICKCKKSLSLQVGNMCFKNQCLGIILLHNPVEQAFSLREKSDFNRRHMGLTAFCKQSFAKWLVLSVKMLPPCGESFHSLLQTFFRKKKS